MLFIFCEQYKFNTMSFSKYLLSLHEGYVEESYVNEVEDIIDNSGFGDDTFGVDKISKPSEEGFATSRKAATDFANASDGEITDVDLIMNVAMPKDTSGFNEEFVFEEECEDGQCVDPNTVPAVPEEDDQFSEPEEDEAVIGSISDTELASDNDMNIDSVEESFTGWDDLF